MNKGAWNKISHVIVYVMWYLVRACVREVVCIIFVVTKYYVKKDTAVILISQWCQILSK